MNLLITRHDKIGDFITILPMLAIMKSQMDCRITVLVSKVNHELAQSIETIDAVILYTENTSELVQEIKQNQFDASISCFIDTRLAWALWRARIKTRIAPATKFAQVFFNKTLKQSRSQSVKTEWQYNVDLIGLLGLHVDYTFTPPLLTVSNKRQTSSTKTVAFHVGSGGSTDGNLSLQDYLRLARFTCKQGDIKVLFTFGPDDKESQAEVEKQLDFDAEIINSSGSLRNFCQLLASVDLFVSTSTGPMHLAGALNINTLSFFGISQFSGPNRWAAISSPDKQTNIQIPAQYSPELYSIIELKLGDILKRMSPVE